VGGEGDRRPSAGSGQGVQNDPDASATVVFGLEDDEYALVGTGIASNWAA
jgi:hypothetical protein